MSFLEGLNDSKSDKHELINCSIAECFAFLVCTKWSNPVIHRSPRTRQAGASSLSIRYLDWNSGLVVSSEDDQNHDRICGLSDIGGHIMKVPVIAFQVLLCMRLEVCVNFDFSVKAVVGDLIFIFYFLFFLSF